MILYCKDKKLDIKFLTEYTSGEVEETTEEILAGEKIYIKWENVGTEKEIAKIGLTSAEVLRVARDFENFTLMQDLDNPDIVALEKESKTIRRVIL